MQSASHVGFSLLSIFPSFSLPFERTNVSSSSVWKLASVEHHCMLLAAGEEEEMKTTLGDDTESNPMSLENVAKEIYGKEEK